LSTDRPKHQSTETARPSSAGLVGVGILALAAFALAAYALLRRPVVASAESPPSAGLEQRLAGLEQRIAALDKERSTSTKPASSERAEGAAPAAATPPAADAASASVSRTDTGDGLFDVVPNAELKGRLGRLVVEFPEANDLKARTETFKAGGGDGLRTDYGDVAVEMTPGEYDVDIGGAIVAGVTIRSGHDTRVHAGVLRLNATGNTRFELFAPGESKSLGTHYGQTDVGLPAGTFEVDVNG
jgi:hypothetical protein